MNLFDPLMIAICNQLILNLGIPQEQSRPGSIDHHPLLPSLAQSPPLPLPETSPRGSIKH